MDDKKNTLINEKNIINYKQALQQHIPILDIVIIYHI
jgi:hypothetical protein